MDDLKAAKTVLAVYRITGIGPTLNGRNGGGDRYYTDGEVRIARLAIDGKPNPDPTENLAPPPFVQMKDTVWDGIADAVGAGER